MSSRRQKDNGIAPNQYALRLGCVGQSRMGLDRKNGSKSALLLQFSIKQGREIQR